MADVKDHVSGRGGAAGAQRMFRDNGDSTYSEAQSSYLWAWDTTDLVWKKLTVDHATGNLNVLSSGGGGGGAVTIADGADVAQGATTDTSTSSTVVGVLKAIKAAVNGTLKVDGSAVTQPVSGTFWQATQPVSGTVTANQGTAGATAWKVDGSGVTQPVSGTFWQATQPVSGTVGVNNFPATQAVSGTVTANQGGAPWSVSQSGSWTVADSTLASSQATKNNASEVATSDNNTRVLLEQILVEMLTLNSNIARLTQPGSQQDMRGDLRLAT